MFLTADIASLRQQLDSKHRRSRRIKLSRRAISAEIDTHASNDHCHVNNYRYVDGMVLPTIERASSTAPTYLTRYHTTTPTPETTAA